MTTPEQFQPAETPEDKLGQLLPLVAENFTPQLGYRIELSNLLLSDIDIATDYKRAFANLLGTSISNEASLVYTYDVADDTVSLESIRFGLHANLQDEKGVIADTIYLQRYADGFVQSFGLGQDTVADTPLSACYVPEASVKALLEPAGLYNLGQGEEMSAVLAHKLSDAKYWKVREQQVIPLPPDATPVQKQMFIVRNRSVSYNLAAPIDNEAAHDDTDQKRPLYRNDYEITFQAILPPHPDEPTVKPIEEATLVVNHNDITGRSFSVVETEYDRYEHPYVIGLPENLNVRSSTHEPNPDEIAAYVKLLEDFAA